MQPVGVEPPGPGLLVRRGIGKVDRYRQIARGDGGGRYTKGDRRADADRRLDRDRRAAEVPFGAVNAGP